MSERQNSFEQSIKDYGSISKDGTINLSLLTPDTNLITVPFRGAISKNLITTWMTLLKFDTDQQFVSVKISLIDGTTPLDPLTLLFNNYASLGDSARIEVWNLENNIYAFQATLYSDFTTTSSFKQVQLTRRPTDIQFVTTVGLQETPVNYQSGFLNIFYQ